MISQKAALPVNFRVTKRSILDRRQPSQRDLLSAKCLIFAILYNHPFTFKVMGFPMSAPSRAEIALQEEIQRLRMRVTELERERQIPMEIRSGLAGRGASSKRSSAPPSDHASLLALRILT